MKKQTQNHLEIDAKEIKAKIKQELGYDSDMIKDSGDEEQLAKMTDLNREKEIYDRKQKRD